MNADGTQIRQMTNNALFDQQPTWRVEPIPPSDISVEVLQPDPARENQSFDFLVKVHNAGLVSAANVSVEITTDGRLVIEEVNANAGGQATVGDNFATVKLANLAVGSTVTIAVQVRALDPGDLSLGVRAFAAIDSDPNHANNSATAWALVRPRNDSFADALTLSGAVGSFAAITLNATYESTLLSAPEPFHAKQASGNPIAGGSSIWYRWFAPSDGQVVFNTKGSAFDTLLAAYLVVEGTQGKFLSQVASNDDTGGRTSEIRFQASDGLDYYIVVDGYGGKQGNGLLNWSQIADVKPAPQPQRIHSLSTTNVLLGRGDLPLTVKGSGFGSGSIIYIYPPNQPIGSQSRLSKNYLSTVLRNDGTQLEATIPKEFFKQAGELRIVVIRGNLESNVATIRVVGEVALPSGVKLQLGRLRIGADVIRQSAPGSGEGETAEEVYKLDGNVQFNDYLLVEGASIEVRINRVANSLKVNVRQGRIVLTNLPRYGNVILWTGDNFEFSLDGEGELTNLLRAVVETPLRERGIEISIERARLLLGTTLDSAGRPIYGIEIFGSLKFGKLFGLVDLPVQFDKIVLTQNDGLRFAGELGPLNFGIPNAFNLEDVYLGFQPGITPDTDSFTGRGRVVTGVGINAAGSLSIRGGKLNGVSGEIEVPPAIGIPIGPVNITGGNLGVDNLLDLSRLKITIGADVTIGHPTVAHVLKLDNVQLSYQLPARFGGSGSLQIFRADAASVHLDFDIPSSTYTFGGGVTLLPNVPVLIVRGELTAGIDRNLKAHLSGYAEGVVQIPGGTGGIYDVLTACGTIPWLNLKVGPCIQFPYEVFSARIAYKNNAFSYSTSIPIVGKITTQIKQLERDVQASVKLVNNLGTLNTTFKFGGSGEGEIQSSVEIGTLTVPLNTPRLIVSVAGASSPPLYDLIAPDGSIITPQTADQFGATYFFNEETHDSIFVIDNPQPGQWSAWTQSGVTDVVELEAWGVNAPPEIDYVTAYSSEDGYDISYSVRDVDDDARVSLYYTTSSTETNGKLIVEDLLESTTGSFRWNPNDGSVPTGQYYVYALADDGVNMPVTMFSPTPVVVVDPLAPQAPSGVVVGGGLRNTIELKWDANVESDLAGYVIRYGLERGVDTVLEQVDVGLSTSYRLLGLQPHASYRLQVVAYDRNLEPNPFNPDQMQVRNRFSPASEQLLASTGDGSPPSVGFLPADSVKGTSGTDLQLDWFIFGDDIEWQQLFVSRDAGQSYDLLAELDPAVRSYAWRAFASGQASVQFKLVVRDTAGNTASVTSEDFTIFSAGTIAFATPTSGVQENAGYVEVLVHRVGGSSGAVSAQFWSIGDTATAGQDYSDVLGEVYFEDGETEQLIRIPILDDPLMEDDERFLIALRLPRGGAAIDIGSEHVVAIHSEDVVLDSDGDGVNDSEESLAPGGGDGNGDGIQDAHQPNVASLATGALGGGITIVVSSEYALSGVRGVAAAEVGLPTFVNPVAMIVDFRIANLAAGTRLSYDLIPHTTSPVDLYMHKVAEWYWFTSNGTLGASFGATQLTVTIQDGLRGDVDQTVDGSMHVLATLGKSTHTFSHQNPLKRLDVNGDDFITPLDALLIVNDLNRHGARALEPTALPLTTPVKFIDPSGDNFVTPIDVLLIVNYLNNQSNQPEGETWPQLPRGGAPKSAMPIAFTPVLLPVVDGSNAALLELPLSDRREIEPAIDSYFSELDRWHRILIRRARGG